MHAKNSIKEPGFFSRLKKSVIKLKNKPFNDVRGFILSLNTTKIDLRV